MYLLESQRLGIRLLTKNDFENLFQILSDPETMKFYPRTCTRKEVENWILKSIKSYSENGFGLWALELKQSKQFIGQCGISLQVIDGKKVPEIGYQINKKYWNKGLATEISINILDFGFKKLNLPEIYIHTYVKNRPSKRVAEKLGMSLKIVYDKQIDDKITMRHLVYSMTQEEFNS